MLEISELKAKKLPELQDIAKSLNVPKVRSFRKLDLIYQILDYQAANPKKVKAALEEKNEKEAEASENTSKKPSKSPARKGPKTTAQQKSPSSQKPAPKDKRQDSAKANQKPSQKKGPAKAKPKS